MKKVLCLFAFIAVIGFCHAQEPLSYEFVIQKDSVPAEQIYVQLVDWIATNFVSVDGDFFHDKEEKLIVKDVLTDFSTGRLIYMCYEGFLRYKLKFQCRDGRFKVQLTNFIHENKPGYGCELGLIMNEPVKHGHGKQDEQIWQLIKEKAEHIADTKRLEMENLIIENHSEDW